MECREKFMILWDRKSQFQLRISTNLPVHCDSFSRGSFSLLRTYWLKANCVPVRRCFRKQAKQRWLIASSRTEVLRHTHAYTSWTHTRAHNGESDCNSVWIKGPRHLLLNLWREKPSDLDQLGLTPIGGAPGWEGCLELDNFEGERKTSHIKGNGSNKSQ